MMIMRSDPNHVMNTWRSTVNAPHQPCTTRPTFELRFASLAAEGCALAFPCDAGGRVDLNSLGERARIDYLFAHAVTGPAFSLPVVTALH
jgi:hypothetical protein